MISLIVVISLSFYLKYFNEGPQTVKENKTLEKIDTNQSNSSTYIENIDYVSSDAKGNKYQITAERAEIDTDNPDIIFLESDWWLDMETAFLYLFFDYTLVTIYKGTLLPDEKVYYLDWST